MIQAEDGIRDVAVTGVQTCALPISRDEHLHLPTLALLGGSIATYLASTTIVKMAAGVCSLLAIRILTIAISLSMIFAGQYLPPLARSEERRVGKECRSREEPYDSSRRRHTRCSRDWSSDVCSSDLAGRASPFADARAARREHCDLSRFHDYRENGRRCLQSAGDSNTYNRDLPVNDLCGPVSSAACGGRHSSSDPRRRCLAREPFCCGARAEGDGIRAGAM